MIPSLAGICLFRGKIVKICVRIAQIPMNVNGTLTKEDVEIIKFFEDNAPFTMIIGNSWIDRDQARQKEEEEFLEQKKQELKDFMTRLRNKRADHIYLILATCMSKIREH
jgi:hypothetical protein